MKRAFELLAIIDDPTEIIAKLGAWIERRSGARDVEIPPDDIAADLDRYLPGNTYGRFNERIVRREVRHSGIPRWFDPREHPGQYGIIHPGGPRIYIQVTLNHERRAEPSTFDSRILTLVETTPEQTSFFEL